MLRRLHKRFPLIIIELLVVIFFIWSQITSQTHIKLLHQELENLTYDLAIKLTATNRPIVGPPVIIVDIDEKSLTKEGKWPWPREKIALLVNNLHEFGVKVIAFDLVYAQPEANVALTFLRKLKNLSFENKSVLKTIEDLAPQMDEDNVLANSFANKNIVLGIIFDNNTSVPSSGQLPTPIATLDPEISNGLLIPIISNYRANVPVLQNAAKNAGFITTIPDSDGILRRTPLLIRYGDNIYPSLALEAARVFSEIDHLQIEIAPFGNLKIVQSIDLGSNRIKTDESGKVLIPFFYSVASQPHLSATDVIHKNVNNNILNNALVLVGTSAIGMSDFHATPIQPAYPGVVIQANVIRGLLTNNFVTSPIWRSAVELLFNVLAGVGMIIVSIYAGPLGIILFAISLIIAAVGFYIWMLIVKHIVLLISLTLILIMTLAIVDLSYGFLFEYRKRKQLKNIFGQYIPPSRVEIISEQINQVSLEAESKELTILFADIVQFTKLAEQLSAASVKELLNRFFTPMTQTIFEHEGTIDKYVGDLIMAFWGAPISDKEHVKHALEAALAMISINENLKTEFRNNNLPEINLNIGLNTGVVSVGDMGSKFRLAYTVLGDAVNLASRIESLTRHYHVKIAVGETTREGQDEFIFRKLDRVKVLGKTQAVTIYELICRREDATDELLAELEKYEHALNYYFKQEWDQAIKLFQTLSEQHPKTYLYHLYLERIGYLKQNLRDKTWDGCYEWQIK